MDFGAARQEMARELEAAQAAPNSDSRFHGVRKVLTSAGTASLNLEFSNGLSLGDIIQRAAVAADAPELKCFAMLMVEALSRNGIIPSTSERSDIDRNICSMMERFIPDILGRFNYPFRGQNFEKRRSIEDLHNKITELLAPLRTPPDDLVGLLGTRTRLAKCLNDSAVENYFGSSEVRELLSDVQRVFEALSYLRQIEDAAFHGRLREAEEAVEQLKARLEGRNEQLQKAVAVFSSAAELIVSQIVKETAPRLSSEIATVRPEPRVAAKRYQLHEEGRELNIVLPLVNRGPGWAYDLTVQAVAESDTIIVEEDVLNIGDVRAGDFSVVLRVLVASPCHEATTLLDVSWRMAGSPERQSRTFTATLEAQRSDVDWSGLEENDPYSITVAEGSRFVGRAARVRSITNRFTRATMESVLLDGQKRVGKSSLALAVRDAVMSQGTEKTRVIYREFGEYGTEDPAETVAALGRTIAEEMLIDLPVDAPVPHYEFKGTLAPLSQLARLMLSRSPEKRFLIILDEFDEIPPELYQHGRLADVFFQGIRTFSGQKNVGVMLVGGERLRYILSSQGDQLNRFSAERLSYFHRSTEWEDYGALIQSPSQPDINCDLACIIQLYDLTNGHPYFTNLLCREVYSAAISARDTEITPAEVSAAFTSLAGNLELNHFAHFWMDGILAAPNLTQDIELDRRRVLIAAARAVRAGDAINLNNVVQHKDADLDAAKVKAFLGEFAQRNVLHEDQGTFTFVLPLFEAWLVNAGITKLIPEQSAQEQAAQAKRIDDQAFVTESETTNLAASWPSYRGQAIGTERIRDWLNQVPGNQDQRILLSCSETFAS